MAQTTVSPFPEYLDCPTTCPCDPKHHKKRTNSDSVLDFTPDGPTHEGTQDFIRHLWKEINHGFSFVPYIGAGFSVSAGIPVIWQFHKYLQQCIAHAVGVRLGKNSTPEALGRGIQGHFFNPRSDQWPAFCEARYSRPDWPSLVLRRYRAIAAIIALETTDKKRKKWVRYQEICQEAFGAMADWRSSLLFLSRIAHTSPPSSLHSVRNTAIPGYRCYTTLALLEPSQEVADACLRKVLNANRPGLNHHLLATLSQLFRIDRIITTNFDDLIEKAFEESRNRLDVYDVHLGDNLPDYDVVSRSRCIIKLHGTRTALRADFSLDSPPTAEECKRFRSYINGPELRINGARLKERNHLIVFGVGLTELRTQTYILDCLVNNPTLKVFVICFHTNDVKAVEETSERLRELIKDKPNELKHRFLILRHGNNGLFLLHTYQWLRKSLPSAYATFPNASRLSVPRVPFNSEARNTFTWSLDNHKYKTLHDQLRDSAKSGKRKERKLIVFHSEKTVNGIGDFASELYRKYDLDMLCLWIELHDIVSPAEIFEVFQEAAYRKLGETDWTPLYTDLLNANSPGHSRTSRDIWTEELKRIVKASPKPILLFLDAREMPGCNREQFNDGLNGWLDKPDDPRAASMIELLRVFVGDGNDRWLDASIQGKTIRLPDEEETSVHIILLLFSPGGSEFEVGCSFLKRLEDGSQFPKSALQIFRFERHRNSDVFNLTQKAISILEWAIVPEEESEHRQHLLLTILSMQRTRHLSVIWSRASNPRAALTSRKYDHDKSEWLSYLAKCDLVMHKEGGFIWVNARLRQILRRVLRIGRAEITTQLLEKEGLVGATEKLVNSLRKWNAVSHFEDIHFNLATWYQLLYASSGTARALLESIYHIMFSVSAGIRFAQSSAAKVQEETLKRATLRINGARNLLQLHLFTIQTEGLPVGSRRRLEYIRDFWFSLGEGERTIIQVIETLHSNAELLKAIAKLQCSAVEVIRSIDRELGEIRRASEAHKSFSIRTVADVPIDEKDVRAQISEIQNKRTDSPETRNRYTSFSICMSSTLQLIFEQDPEKDPAARQKHWVRWWRWSGMLALANHNFDKAESALSNAIILSRRVDEVYPLMRHSLIYRVPRKSKRTIELDALLKTQGFILDLFADDYPLLIETLHAIDLLAFAKIRRAQALRRMRLLGIKGLHGQGKYSESTLLKEAYHLADCGLRLVDEIHNSKHIPSSGDHNLHWCRSRLLISQARALIGRPDSEESKASIHTMSLLSNAVAALRSATAQRNSADITFIELIRAENRLREAGAIKITINGVGQRWDTWLYGKLCSDGADPLDGFDLTENRFSLEQLKARTHDAVRFLERGEPTLQTMRRNLFWTTWYFQRRLNSIVNLLWISVLEGNQVPIPCLGPNDSFAREASEPERILDEAGRMIRTDSYRYACILLGYFFCVLAYWHRTKSSKQIDVRERLTGLRGKLDHGIAQLAQIEECNWPASPDSHVERVGDEAKLVVKRIREIVARGRTILSDG